MRLGFFKILNILFIKNITFSYKFYKTKIGKTMLEGSHDILFENLGPKN